MRTPARFARHPIHPMLVVFPIGLWVFSVVCDLVFLLALLMFVMSFLARSVEVPLSWSLALSAIGLLPLAMGGWLGGELVFVQGLGVEPQAERQRAIRPGSEPEERRSFPRTA